MGRRLLIDYTKNTAPLQDDDDPQRLEIGISLRYHEPEMSLSELDESCKEMGFIPHKVMPPNPRYPLLYLEKLEVETKPDMSDKRRQKSRSPKRTHSKIVTFKVPSKAVVRRRRNAIQYSQMHHSDSEFSYFSTHSSPLQVADIRSSIISKDDTFAMSVQTAPAAAATTTTQSTSPTNLDEQSRSSFGKAMERLAAKHDDDEEEEEDLSDDEKSASFLPTALMDGSSSSLNSSSRANQAKRQKKKKKKRGVKRNPSLDDWFNRGNESVASLTIEEDTEPQDEPEDSDNTSTSRSSTASSSRRGNPKSSRKKSLRSLLQRSLSSDSVTSESSRRSKRTSSTRSSITSISSRSLLAGGSHPLGPRRRMLPLRKKSFEDARRVDNDDDKSDKSVAASANTRRGGRRPGNRGRSPTVSGQAPPKRMMPARTKSTDSFRSLKSHENSYSFMAGSRIRVRHAGATDNRDEDDISMVSTASAKRGRRGKLGRAKSCEDMPSLLRTS